MTDSPRPSKVFCLGMNRTGSTSLYEYLLELGYNATHDPNWWYWRVKSGLDQFDAYTDGYEGYKPWRTYPNLWLLQFWFPDAKFVINTRPLDAWLTSRLKHNSANYRKWKRKTDPHSLLKGWVRNRNHWHRKLIRFSEEYPEKTLWVNIHDPEASAMLKEFIAIKTDVALPHSNQINNNPEAAGQVNEFLDRYIREEDHQSIRTAHWK